MAKKKKRIYEYAKDLNLNSADLMKKLKFMGYRVDNIFNAVDESAIEQIKRQMGLHLFEDLEQIPTGPQPPRRKPEPEQITEPPARQEPAAARPAANQQPAQPPKPAPAARPPETKKTETAAKPPAPSRPAGPTRPTQQYQPQAQQRPPAQQPPSQQQHPPAPQPPVQQQPPSQQPRPPYQQQRPQSSQGPRPVYQDRRPGGGQPSQQRPPYQGQSGQRPPYQGQSGQRPPYQGQSGQRPPYQGQSGPKQQSDAPPLIVKPTSHQHPQGPQKKKFDEKRDKFEKGKPKRPGWKATQPEVVLEDAAPAVARTEEDIYTSPAKRLEAIKARGLQQKERAGKKTTFLKKRSKKDKQDRGGADAEPDLMPTKKRVRVAGPMTVKELAHELGAKSSDIIMFLMKDLSLMSTLNQSLDIDIITLVAEHFGSSVFHDLKAEAALEEDAIPIDPMEKNDYLEPRPPVVTVLGHVDHGKTKLLDAIRHTDVVATEFGGITQHIGAYQITHNNRKITFLDTPGHAAFTQLRARGAKVTDLAVLVVAADDGVMPQTTEAIDHAREANVPILVAVNKIDKANANPDRVRQQLSDKGLIPEAWGGNTVFVEISAKMKQNIEELLEMIFLVTDILELKANPKRKALGTVIEAKIDKGKGPVATVLVQNGTLYTGDFIVAGATYGKIRALENERGERVPFAGPSAPIEVHGLHVVPQAGDKFFVIEDEKTAREIASDRRLKSREDRLRYEGRISLEDLFKRIQQDKLKEFKIVLKGDVQGSVEAITQSLETIKHEQVRVNVIRAGVGDIKETDIMLAAAGNAVVMGYNVDINPDAQAQAQNESVEVRHYTIIYNLLEDVRRAMAGMLAPEFDEVFTGRAEIRHVFASSRFGNIAGSMVLDGEISVNDIAKVLRGGKEVFKSKIGSLRRFKDSSRSVAAGFECGIIVDKFSEAKEGDIVETFKMVEKKKETI
jgi:translation initiation factor IF-2